MDGGVFTVTGINCRGWRDRLFDILVSGAEVERTRLSEFERDAEGVPSGEVSLAIVAPRAKGLETITSDDLRAWYHTASAGGAGAVNTSSSVRAPPGFTSTSPLGPSSNRGRSPVFLKMLDRLYFDVGLCMMAIVS